MKNNSTNGQMAATPRSAAADSPALAESLKRMRRQTPAESLGQPTGNGLMKPFLQASVITVVLLALLTVVPYFVSPSKTAEAKAPVAEAAPAETPKTETPAKPDAVAKTTPGNKAGNKGDILEKLGENGTKTSSPKINPLDKKDDDLLKDIK